MTKPLSSRGEALDAATVDLLTDLEAEESSKKPRRRKKEKKKRKHRRNDVYNMQNITRRDVHHKNNALAKQRIK